MIFDELTKLLVENHALVLLSGSLNDITYMLKFAECRKLPGVVVENAALCLLVVLPNNRYASEGCCKTFVGRIPNGSFLDSELWRAPKMNLASSLHEVLVVEEVHEYQRVGAESFRKHDCFV
jgi:hypothetical protein